jgi:hypothetical protein
MDMRIYIHQYTLPTYVYARMHAYVYVKPPTHTICIHICLYTICMYVHVCDTCTYIYIYAYACMMYVCIHVNMHV